MQVMKWSVIALAVAAGTSQLAFASAQSESNGFVEDSSLNVLSRNLYFYRDFRNAGPDLNDDPQEWGQGFIATYESGFTQGTIGFGVDAIGLLGIKLDSGKGRAGSGLFPTGSDGRSQDDYSEAGGAVKLRLSNTVLKYGDQFTALPVLSTDDSRLLPEVAEGFLVTSNEIEGLELNAGRFTAINAQNQTYHDSLGLKGADVFGGTYSFTDDLSTSLYYSDVEDSFKKYYGNVNYTFGISEGQSLNFDFNIYRSNDEGRKLAGEIGVTAWSFAAAYTVGAHTFKVTHQRINGDQPFDYLGMGPGTFHDSIYLANSSQLVDFNGPNERSWGLFYDLNMASYGVPGLTFHARYIRGTDVDGSKMDPSSPYAYYADSEDHWERDLAVGYVVQSGPAKDLSFKLRQATHRIGNGKSDVSSDQFRLIIEFPYEIF